MGARQRRARRKHETRVLIAAVDDVERLLLEVRSWVLAQRWRAGEAQEEELRRLLLAIDGALALLGDERRASQN